MTSVVPPLHSAESSAPRVQRPRITVEAKPAPVVSDTAGGVEHSVLERDSNGRIAGIDLARGLALLGMFAVHVNLTGDGEPLPGWLQWVFEQPSGRASVLFVSLAGVSLSLLRIRDAPSAETSALRRRGAILLIGGLLLSQTVWSASILEHYGVLFLLAPLLLRRSNRELWALATAGLIGGPIFQLLVLPSTLSTRLSDTGVSGWLVETVESLVFSGTYPLVIWFGFFCVGIRIGRMDVASRRNAGKLFAGGVVGTVLVAGVVGILGHDGVAVSSESSASFETSIGIDPPGSLSSLDAATIKRCSRTGGGGGDEFWTPGTCIDKALGYFGDVGSPGGDALQDGRGAGGERNVDLKVLLDTTGHSGQIGWTIQSQAIAVAILGMCLAAGAMFQRMLKPLAMLGSMSLSAYLIHIVLVRDVFDRLTEDNDWSSFELVGLLLLLQGLLVFLASAIMTISRRGPAEWLMERLVRPQG